MEIINVPSGPELEASNIGGSITRPERSAADYQRPTPGFSLENASDALGAQFQLDNWLVNMAHAGIFQDRGTTPDNWNPYSYIRQNWDDARRKDMELSIRRGDFQDAVSPQDVERISGGILRERQLRETASRSDLGATLGGLLAAAADPLVYTGAGWVEGGAGILGRAGRFALQAGVSTAASEAVLQDLQTMRSLHESIMNIGGAAVGAGGLGAFLGAMGRRMATAGIPTTAEGVVDRTLADASRETRPLGAAATERDALPVNLLDPAPTKLGGLTIGDRTLGGPTPLFRLLGADSDAARNMLTRLADTRGQILADAAGNVVAAPVSAEALRTHFMSEWFTGWQLEAKDGMRDVSRQLGEMGAPKLDAAEFNGLLERAVTRRLDTEAGQQLVQQITSRYGDQGGKLVTDLAKRLSDSMAKINAEKVEPELVRRGVVRDVPRLEKAESTLSTLRSARDKEMEKLAEQRAIAKATSERSSAKGGTMGAEAGNAVAELDAKIAERRAFHQAQIAPWDKVRGEELAKPEPLGKDYGHAQLYDKQSLKAHEAEFKAMLGEKLAGDPHEGWLREQHGLNTEQFKALADEDPERYKAILQEWVGDEHYVKVSVAQRRLEAAKQRAEGADADLKRVSYFHGRAEENLGKDTRALAKAERAQSQARRDLAAAQREADKQTQRALVDAATAARHDTLDRLLGHEGAPLDPNVRKARLEGRINEIENRIRAADREVAEHEARLSAIGEAHAAFDQAVAGRKVAKQALDESLRTANKQRGQVAKNLNELRRQLKDADRTPAMEKVASDIFDAITNEGHLPRGSLEADRTLTETGRMKERSINWTPEEHDRLAELGILRDDLHGVLDSQYKSLAGHLAIREALGIGEVGGYKSWGEALDAVVKDYQEKITAAAGNRKEQGRLIGQQKRALEDINLLKDRLVGGDLSGVRNKDSVFHWATSKARDLAFTNYAPGFGLSSLTDFSALLMNHKLGDLIPMWANRLSKTMSAQDRRFISAIFHATEYGLHDAEGISASTFNSAAERMGIGARGTNLHRVTSAIDWAGEKVKGAASRLSFLPQMTEFIRTSAAMDATQQLDKMLTKGVENLNPQQLAHLRMVGLDDAKAARLKDAMDRFGTRDAHGYLHLNIDKWEADAAGQQASRDLSVALQKDMSLSSPATSIADTPAFMSNGMGKLLMQFQTFNFVTYNRVISTAMQRMAHTGDWRMAGVLATGFPLAMLNWLAKDLLAKKDPMERYSEGHRLETMSGLMDRAGFFGWTSPYVDAATKFAGISGTSSRYSQNNWYQSLFGAQFSQLTNFANVANQAREYATGDGSAGKLGQAAARVSPFGMYARFFSHLMSD